MSKPKNVHGTGLLLGSTGVLLRGPSGAGKSVLALSLLDRWDSRELPAFLVSDDRVDLAVTGRQLSMQAPAKLAGLIELRGRGIVSRPHKDLVTLHLVIDLVPDMARMLEEDALTTELSGITLPRAPVPYGSVISLGHQILLVVEAIAALPRP
jgi:serine kinase of HPr protein (carbohydrate metabolism regulator)